MTYEVEIGGRTAQVDVRAHPDGGWWVAVDGQPARHVTGRAVGAAEWKIVVDHGRRVAAVVHGDRIDAQLADGTGLTGTVVDPRDKALAALSGGGEGTVCTPMPGAIVRVLVEAGATVATGDVLVVVEAMKMENEFKAPVAGIVETVHVSAGESVESGAQLVTIAAVEGP